MIWNRNWSDHWWKASDKGRAHAPRVALAANIGRSIAHYGSEFGILNTAHKDVKKNNL